MLQVVLASNLLKKSHLSPENTAQTCSIAINERQQMFSTTGHPGHWNDKAMVLFDEDFVLGIHEIWLYDDVEFELLAWPMRECVS